MAKQAVVKAAARAASNLRPALRAGQRRFGTRTVDGNTALGKAEILARDTLPKMIPSTVRNNPGKTAAGMGLGALGLSLMNSRGGLTPAVEEETPWSLVDEEDGFDMEAARASMENSDPTSDIGAFANNPMFKPKASPSMGRPRPKASPMTSALSSPAPVENGISSFAQGGVKAPDFGVDSSGLEELIASIGQETSKDPYSMGLPPEQKAKGGGGDFMKSLGPLLAALLFGRMMK